VLLLKELGNEAEEVKEAKEIKEVEDWTGLDEDVALWMRGTGAGCWLIGHCCTPHPP
jgi:hypothetical protein